MFGIGSSSKIKCEDRRDIRVGEKCPIAWHIKDKDLSGRGIVKNISTSGLLFETSTSVPLPDHCIFLFDFLLKGKINFLPAMGKMIWSQKKNFSKSTFLYGVEFCEPKPEILSILRERIQFKIAKLESAEKIRNAVGYLLFVVMTILAVIAAWYQISIYRNIEKSNHLIMVQSNRQASLYWNSLEQYQLKEAELLGVSKDLQATKVLLAQTETSLAKVQKQQGLLESEAIAMKQQMVNQESLASQVQELKQENVALTQELATLSNKVRIFEGNIESLQEGKYTLTLYKKQIRVIKMKMRDLKHKAFLAKVAAQKELDKMKLAQGNRGYIMQAGKLTSVAFPSPELKKKITVDLTLFE